MKNFILGLFVAGLLIRNKSVIQRFSHRAIEKWNEFEEDTRPTRS